MLGLEARGGGRGSRGGRGVGRGRGGRSTTGSTVGKVRSHHAQELAEDEIELQVAEGIFKYNGKICVCSSTNQNSPTKIWSASQHFKKMELSLLTTLYDFRAIVEGVLEDNQIFGRLPLNTEFFLMSQRGNVKTPSDDLNNKTVVPFGPKLVYKMVERLDGTGITIETSSTSSSSSADISSFFNESRITIAFGQPPDYEADIKSM